MNNRIIYRLMHPASEQILVGSFALFIMTGTILLMQPFASGANPLGFVDALFTATSATCVTGLTVVGTDSHFTLWGQIIILIMIQAGGLGIISFSTAFLYMLEGRLSIGSRDLLFDTLAQGPVPNIKRLLKIVFTSSFVVEFIGAAILSLRFLQDMSPARAVYFGLFHAVSAFCNAGFSLFPDSLVRYQGDAVVNLTIILLIIIGGLGFVVIYELLHTRERKYRRLSYHSRIVLATSGLLIGGGALLFFALEWQNTLGGLPLHTKFLTSLFQSITPRTAGFNTTNINHLTNPTLFVIIVLMFIGASPSSCGGGIKVTTAAVLFAFLRARFHNQDQVNLLNRQVHSDSLSRAMSIGFFSLLLVVVATMLLLITELSGIAHTDSRGMFLELLFEATSAFGTVGLSVGVTPSLTITGRIIIVALMFIGRLGPLTVAMSVGRKKKLLYNFARERVLIG